MTRGPETQRNQQTRSIAVVEYDPEWLVRFQELRERIWPHVSDLATSVEHVGSTSVPGLAAKPTIDLTIVAVSERDVAAIIERLSPLGYGHRGDLGIPGRQAFHQPAALPSHHLYVCPPGNLGLRNHLAVRDYLRSNPDMASEYGRLKRQLAREFPTDIESYTEGKSAFLARVLSKCGLTADQLDQIEEANRSPNR